jgi:hypothetical protein
MIPISIRRLLIKAPIILVNTPPINTATISLTSGELTSFKEILNIGLNILFKKRVTENRLKKNRTNSCAR